MKRIIKKCFRNCVDVRDYDVLNCIKQEDDMHIEHDGKTMTLSPHDLVAKRKYISKQFFSTNGGKDYRLYSYEWTPNEEP